MNRILLDLILFNKTHTTINQADTIIKILKKINFGQKLLGITTDNAANMLVMGRILKEKISDEFDNQDDLLILLEPMYHATVMLFSSTLFTQSNLRMCNETKFASYWVHLNELSTILGLLDPHNKLSTYVVNEHKQAIRVDDGEFRSFIESSRALEISLLIDFIPSSTIILRTCAPQRKCYTS
ncbi:1469_t:CDS:2 [Racocetra persica]|uniref:1469_t:CDS:1 n=1 Tax=Racocetra persica TaxID=160502 RepID=A0ACA9MFM4_9GLOM|nr:1469_t:CDS:2 [Racocetra persica]